MKRLFLTGESGFVGKIFYGMAEEIARAYGWELVPAATKYDLLDPASLDCVLCAARPDGVIHLAGQSFVPEAIRDPEGTLQVNLLGTLHLLQALKRNDFRSDFLYVSSSDVYGHVAPEALPILETQPVCPQNPYAVSKAAAELLCYQWSRVEPWRIIIARPFNHIGPGQREEFVISGIARKIARIKLGLSEPQILVGDIDVTRDFLDVRDVVRAYLSLMDQGKNGETYNVCSCREILIREMIDRMADIEGVKLTIAHDSARFRPSDQRRVRGSCAKILAATGWRPEMPLEQSLRTVLSDWERIERNAFSVCEHSVDIARVSID
jgi:GDP-4-dehydro-6-deoxy-D-mannose reductase